MRLDWQDYKFKALIKISIPFYCSKVYADNMAVLLGFYAESQPKFNWSSWHAAAKLGFISFAEKVFSYIVHGYFILKLFNAVQASYTIKYSYYSDCQS